LKLQYVPFPALLNLRVTAALEIVAVRALVSAVRVTAAEESGALAVKARASRLRWSRLWLFFLIGLRVGVEKYKGSTPSGNALDENC
jgi:hypothetical protein